MGKYNPHSPEILGNEWVPIREDHIDIDVETEYGYTFRIDHSVTVVSGGIFIDERGPAQSGNIVMMHVYESGKEDLSGPVKRLVIPATNVVGTVPAANGTFGVDGINATDAVRDAADTQNIWALGEVDITSSFDVTSYTAQLSGKRILDVNILYTVAGFKPVEGQTVLRAFVTNGSENIQYNDLVVESANLNALTAIQKIALGNVNMWLGPTNVNDTVNFRRYPWRYDDLARFASGATNPLQLYIQVDADLSLLPFTPFYLFGYIALEVVYCEETRILYGGSGGVLSFNSVLGYPGAVRTGINKIHLRPSDTFAVTGKVLTPNEYAVTASLADTGDYAFGGADKLRQLRQLYELPTHSGFFLRRTLKSDRVPTRAATNSLPQLSLHTRSAVVTGTHVYGEVLGAPVYDGVTATQEIRCDEVAPATATLYPQVRFYARRFGDTDVALTLTGVNDPNSASVSISVEDFDALPEIVDGWREVTLRFQTFTPTFSSADGTPDWRWSATGLSVTNQWQILSMDASGADSSGVFNVDVATYGAPVGASVELTHSGAADTSADSVIIFSQDPPIVSGLAVVITEQSLTGIGTECSTTPECIPTGLYYHALTWTPVTSLPVTGFGYYELQRQDDDDDPDTWNTILQASSYVVTGFSDFEARVGVESRYRVRTINALDFAGSWSSEAASTLTSPGVLGAGSDGNSVLIFTTNERQDGSSNLAYVQTWDRDVAEDFAFPEASAVQLQERYQRDYVTAFMPTERGGERFTRALLVQNAAVSTGRVRDGFRSLRDMAWDAVSYICVRNELGDRWFANVQVPSGRVQRNRRLYVAQINVIETTDTPCVVELPEE